ncbi:DUF1254 domain-containing protein [Nocardioides sp. KIGAM211]|uniref:DUF1254 domain-containing protein n=1 Tax=Nocardioides luti TaxID=2761101 RepID=A0A7X0RHN7_9ACTN|nr:DUF1254 domain-containing protein [Nocardioides luti]MBB6627214.1 DUF1254 domain-containing protein [Nocardioides luti]
MSSRRPALVTAGLVLAALVAGPVATGSPAPTPAATASSTERVRADLLPDCVYGASARGLRGYEARVERDAQAYADRLDGATPAERRRAATTFAAAEAAYVYGLPLVNLHDTVRKFRFRNTIVSVAALADPDTRAVVSPNVDTAYSVGWLSLTQGPLVIEVPDTHGRFYTFQFMDAFTNSFAYLGSGSTGTKAGSYVLVPPGYEGDLPAGLPVLHSPTNTIWLLGRTLVDGPDQTEEVKPILQGYRTTPLAEWEAGGRGESIVLDQQPSFGPKPVTPTGTDFVATLNQELTIDPPPARQDCVLKALAPAGVEQPDRSQAAVLAADSANQAGNPQGSSESTPQNDAVAAGTRAAVRLIDHASTTFNAVNSRGNAGWSVMTAPWIGDFARKYLGRGLIATNLLGANVPHIATYPTSYDDSRGRPLTGRHRYAITFPKGQLPPVKAFWSLTMYQRDNFLHANEIDRYAVGDRTRGLRLNPDGSLTIYLQHRKPHGAKRAANWLPAPAGAFHVILRLYLPRDRVLDGGWRIAGLERRG